MQNKWTLGANRDSSIRTKRKLTQDEIRFRRQEERKKLVPGKDAGKGSTTK